MLKYKAYAELLQHFQIRPKTAAILAVHLLAHKFSHRIKLQKRKVPNSGELVSRREHQLLRHALLPTKNTMHKTISSMNRLCRLFYEAKSGVTKLDLILRLTKRSLPPFKRTWKINQIPKPKRYRHRSREPKHPTNHKLDQFLLVILRVTPPKQLETSPEKPSIRGYLQRTPSCTPPLPNSNFDLPPGPQALTEKREWYLEMSGRKWSLRLRGGRRDRGSGAPVTDQRRKQLGFHSLLRCDTRVSATATAAATALQPSPTSCLPYQFPYVPLTFSMGSRIDPSGEHQSEVWFTTLSAEGVLST